MNKFEWEEKKEKLQPKDRNPRLLDKEIDISIKLDPKKALKGLLLIAVLLFAFYLGRWNASPDCPSCVVGESSSSGLSGFFSSLTGLFHADDAVITELENEPAAAEQASEPAPAVPEQTESSSPAPEEVVAEETPVVEAAAEEPKEDVITYPYRKVSIAITNVKIKWMETWGKITGLDFTIKNNEEGTIMPDHFIMAVQGYPDEASKKEVPLPDTAREIRSKTSVSGLAVVPQGFGYHEKTVGSLDNVEIKIILFDFEGHPMASFNGRFDLRG